MIPAHLARRGIWRLDSDGLYDRDRFYPEVRLAIGF